MRFSPIRLSAIGSSTDAREAIKQTLGQFTRRTAESEAKPLVRSINQIVGEYCFDPDAVLGMDMEVTSEEKLLRN